MSVFSEPYSKYVVFMWRHMWSRKRSVFYIVFAQKLTNMDLLKRIGSSLRKAMGNAVYMPRFQRSDRRYTISKIHLLIFSNKYYVCIL